MRKFLSGLAALMATTALMAPVPARAGTNAWTALPSPTGSALINVISAQPGIALTRYAATQSGMYISRNGGQSWQLSNSGIVPTPAGYYIVNDLAITSTSLYIAPNFLQKSSDGGNSWVTTGWVTENPQALVLAVHPGNPNTVYAGSNQGVYKSSDGAVTWKYLAGNSPVYALTVDPGNPAVIFRAVASGIYRSTDAGLSWSQVSTQLTSVRTLVVDPGHSMTVYAGTNGSGVYKSIDGGSSWQPINRCLPAGQCAPLTLDRTWIKNIIVDAGTVYLGATEGLFKSVDGGASWTQANNGPIGVSAMMLDPLNANTVIAAYGNQLYSYTFSAASDADRIFNWAEASYPQYFAPAGAPTQLISGYQARYYSATQNYVGTLDGQVYVHGAVFGGLLYVGTTAQLLPLALAAGY
ncbi:WD40/YVTN/BNR-like repeat-containing protein [Aquabacterium sp.]|uniref:WD40/YVTN/BNR-like repeat-containing protein n=1 Tax=Aquabacterium sp. TaxID=1872578 RepID=UPI002CDA0967|nr:hypothetical protein [Aquabacterium sp.]HSW06753.1 hypothetical protein [Aquabacterium sp.]